MADNLFDRLKRITTFIFDVDGVLTDGSLTLMPSGELVRTMNTRDGMAMRMAVKNGYTIGIITGGRSEAVKSRLQGLGITDIYLGADDKTEALEEIMLIHDAAPEQVLYMGDDINDYTAMERVGMACCPADATTEIKAIAHYISPIKGGKGCARDMIERTLRLQNKWFEPAPKDQ